MQKKKRGFKGPGTLHSKDSLQKNMSGLEQLLDTFSGNKAKAYGLHFLYKEIWVGTLWDPRCNNKYGYLTRLGRRRQNISVFTWQCDWSPAHWGAIHLVVTRRTLAECPCRDINVSLGSIAPSPLRVSTPSNEKCWYCHRANDPQLHCLGTGRHCIVLLCNITI